MRVLCVMLLVALAAMPALGLTITPDRQLIKPGANYSFVLEGANNINEVSIVNNFTKAVVNWEKEIRGNTVIIKVPENVDFAEYILRANVDGKTAEARMVVKPPLTIMLATFSAPIFLGVGMVGGGVYSFARKGGILRYAGIAVAILGAFILFGVTVAIVTMQTV